MKTLKDILSEGVKHDTLHHMSGHDIDKFHPLSHFGTYKAAHKVATQLHTSEWRTEKANPPMRDRVHHKVRLINKGNTVHLDHDSQTHEPAALMNSLHDHGVFSKSENDHHQTQLRSLEKKHGWNSLHTKEYAAKAIRDKGVHTISYNNEFEHVGSKSYIITHHSQVHTIKKTHVQVKNSSYDPKANKFGEYPKKV